MANITLDYSITLLCEGGATGQVQEQLARPSGVALVANRPHKLCRAVQRAVEFGHADSAAAVLRAVQDAHGGPRAPPMVHMACAVACGAMDCGSASALHWALGMPGMADVGEEDVEDLVHAALEQQRPALLLELLLLRGTPFAVPPHLRPTTYHGKPWAPYVATALWEGGTFARPHGRRRLVLHRRAARAAFRGSATRGTKS